MRIEENEAPWALMRNRDWLSTWERFQNVFKSKAFLIDWIFQSVNKSKCFKQIESKLKRRFQSMRVSSRRLREKGIRQIENYFKSFLCWFLCLFICLFACLFPHLHKKPNIFSGKLMNFIWRLKTFSIHSILFTCSCFFICDSGARLKKDWKLFENWTILNINQYKSTSKSVASEKLTRSKV